MSDPNSSMPVPVQLTEQLSSLTAQQKAFLAGYLWAESNGAASAVVGLPAAAAVGGAPQRSITVISASATGNAAGIAKKLTEKLKSEALDVTLTSAGSYKARQLAKEDIVVISTSTQGDGEPPEEGVPLHSYLFGKKAPKLDGVSFAVIGLGDSSYPLFCQAGIDFDTKLGELGAERLMDRVDCDVDYEAASDAWIDAAVAKLKDVAGGSGAAVAGAVSAVDTYTHEESAYNKDNPYTATLLTSHPLVTDNAGRIIQHVEIDLDESGLQYQVGDALGIVTNNPSELVDEVLGLCGLSGDENIEGRAGTANIRQALAQQCDLNQLTPKFLADYAATAGSDDLSALVEDKDKLQDFQAWTPLVGLLDAYPQKLEAQRLYDGLKPLAPRLYSIASSQEEVGEEVHLCVGLVDIEANGRVYHGSASGLLSNRLEEGDEVQVFVEPNPRFRLPESGDTPVIMIGPGTGIAPFRAFMQQRNADGAQGRNWLFFGNRNYRDDFLYHAEWIEYRDSGLLHDVSLAWSRDGEDKVYVQDKIRENAEAFWQAIEEGAHIYVCGDASRMAKDVERAILDVIAEQGGKDEDDAVEYLNELREADRYQRDVY